MGIHCPCEGKVEEDSVRPARCVSKKECEDNKDDSRKERREFGGKREFQSHMRDCGVKALWGICRLFTSLFRATLQLRTRDHSFFFSTMTVAVVETGRRASVFYRKRANITKKGVLFILLVSPIHSVQKVIIYGSLLFVLSLSTGLLLSFCGVFQEAKDGAEDHSTGRVFANHTTMRSSNDSRPHLGQLVSSLNTHNTITST